MIVLILIFGFVLRFIYSNQSFWIDEATSVLTARHFSFLDIITKFAPGDFHPPLYYLLLKFWIGIFGDGEVGVRLFSVLLGLSTIYAIYLIGKKIADKKVGLISALFLATSGLHVYYSQEARMYALSTFLVSLAVLFFLKILKSNKLNYWVIFSILLTAIFFTDYLPLLILPVFWIYVLIYQKDKVWRKQFLFAHVPLVITFILWWPILNQQLNGGLSVITNSPLWWSILGKTSFKELSLIPAKFIFGRISFDNKMFFGLITLVASLFYGVIILQFKVRKAYPQLLGWLIVPIALSAIVGFKVSVFQYFRLVFVLPAMYLLLAIGCLALKKKFTYIAIFIILGVNLLSSIYYLLNPKFHREDWRGLVGFVAGHSIEERTGVLFVANSQMEAYRYYSENQFNKVPPLSPSDNWRKYNTIWLMRYVKDVFDPDDKARSSLEKSGYFKLGEYNFNGIVIWKYIRS